MRIVVFSDVHGNLPAFEKMLQHAGPADQYICLGDLVNYGPWSEECVQLANSLKNCISIVGNHERYFLEGSYHGTHPLPKQFFDCCYPNFKSFDIIKAFRQDYLSFNYRFVHTIENRNIYPDTPISLTENVFIGHSHHQFQLKDKVYQLYNVGSVGQNRKYINLICYAVFYPLKNQTELCHFTYDISPLIQKMRSENYPSDCINYYLNKQRFALTS